MYQLGPYQPGLYEMTRSNYYTINLGRLIILTHTDVYKHGAVYRCACEPEWTICQKVIYNGEILKRLPDEDWILRKVGLV